MEYEVRDAAYYRAQFEWLWRQYPAIRTVELVNRYEVKKFSGGTDYVLMYRINGQRFSQSENGVVEAGIANTLEREVAHKVSAYLKKDLDDIAPQVFDRAAEREQRRFERTVKDAGYQGGELVPLHQLPQDIARDVTMMSGSIDDIKRDKRESNMLEVKTSATRASRRGRPRGRKSRASSPKKGDKSRGTAGGTSREADTGTRG